MTSLASIGANACADQLAAVTRSFTFSNSSLTTNAQAVTLLEAEASVKSVAQTPPKFLAEIQIINEEIMSTSTQQVGIARRISLFLLLFIVSTSLVFTIVPASIATAESQSGGADLQQSADEPDAVDEQIATDDLQTEGKSPEVEPTDGALRGGTGAEESLLIGTSGSGAEWRIERGDDQNYRLSALLNGHNAWTSPQGSVGLRTPGDADYRYFPYQSVQQAGGAVRAVVELTTSGGSIIEITDTFTVDEGRLLVARGFIVREVGTDSNSGFSLSFALQDTPAAAPDSYQWFAPGTWYGNSANDSFTKLNNMAFDGRVTSMSVDNLGAPLVMAFRDAMALSIADRSEGKSQTVSADRQAQNTKTIIDGAFRLAGLGVRASSAGGTEIFHSYPAWSKNYRNRYSDKPEINRYLPLTAGIEGSTSVEIGFEGAADFEDAITATWRSAYAERAKVADRFDTQIHFDTLVDYLDDSYGIDGGRPQFMVHYDHHNATSGFLHRNADVGWILLAQGHERSDQGMVSRARTVISDQVKNGGLDHAHNPRSTAEAHYSVLRAYVVDKAAGVENDEWLDKVASYAASLPPVPSIYAVAPLVEFSRVTGDATYREAAVRAADAAWEGGHKNLKFFGSLEDYAGGPAEHDREASYLALEAYIALAQSSASEVETEKWVGHAKTAATIAETWQRIEDLAMVPADADESLIMYGNDDIPPYGISVIHAGSNAGDQYGALMAPEFYQLYEFTGDEHFKDFAVYLEKNSMLYTNLGDKAGWMADRLKGSGLGFTNEYLGSGANDYWDNNRRGDGHDSNLGWTSYVLAAMTQRTLDLYDSYSLTSPSTSPIGLDAYYSVVNRATGNSLTIENASRADNAQVTVAATDSSDKSQQWLLENLGDGSFKMVNRDSGKVLNLVEGAGSPGVALRQSVFMPSLAYTVTFTDPDHGWHHLKLNGSGNVVEESANGVHMATAGGIDNQQWKLVPRGDVRLRSPGTTEVLEVNDGQTLFSPLADHASRAQRWSVVPLSSGYSAVISRVDGRALTRTASGVRTEAALAAQAHASSGRTEEGYALNQQWSIDVNMDGTISLTDRQTARTDKYQLQTAGPATTEAPASVISVLPTFSVVEMGQQLSLPETVTTTKSDGTQVQESVSWKNQPDASTAGTFHFYGQLVDVEVRAAASVIVLPAGGITNLAPVLVETPVNVLPQLPQTISGQDASGRHYSLPVTWDQVLAEDVATAGAVQIQGSIVGVARKASATVRVTDQVAPVLSAEPIRAITTPGVIPTLPSAITVAVEGGTQEQRAVVWEAVAQEEVENPGYLQVSGHVGDIDVFAYVTVAIFYDDFSSGTMDRWSISPGANYSVTGGVASVAKPSASQWAFAKDGADPLVVEDVVVESSIRLDSDQNGGLFVRAPQNNDNDGYYLGYEGHWANAVTGKQSGGNWNQWKYSDGGASGQGVFHTLRMVVDEDSVTEYINSSPDPFLQTFDESFPSGRVGVRSWQAAMSMDYFLVAPIPEELRTSRAEVSTPAGTAPVLPGVVLATLADGSQANVAVTWDEIDSQEWQSEGTFTVLGRTEQGTSAELNVTVSALPGPESAVNPLVVTPAGQAPELPSAVAVIYSDGHKEMANVSWDVAPDFAPAESAHTVWGEVEGAGLPVAASVVVASYVVDFAADCPAGWRTFEGQWSCGERGYRVSDGGWSGAKAVATGVTSADMVYQGKIRVDNGGRKQAGLIFRVTRPGNGADNYSGYYFGVDGSSQSVVLGRSDGSWTELAAKPNVSAVVPGEELTLRAVVTGQRIRLYVDDMSEPVIDYTETSSVAPREGSIGVRGYNSSYSIAEAMLAPAPNPLGIEVTNAMTVRGVTPRLPSVVSVTDWDGERATRQVKWRLEGVSFSGQSVTVEGEVAGTSMKAEAVVTILEAIPTSAVPGEVETSVGLVPELPQTALVRLSNGDSAQLPVSQWETIDPSWVQETGTFEITGEFAASTGFRARIVVTVTDPESEVAIIGITPVSVTTNAGVAPGLPPTVEVVYSDASREQKPVRWNDISPGSYALGGVTFRVEGEVEGADIPAEAIVTVVAGETKPGEPGEEDNQEKPAKPAKPEQPEKSGQEGLEGEHGNALSATGGLSLSILVLAGALLIGAGVFRRAARRAQ